MCQRVENSIVLVHKSIIASDFSPRVRFGLCNACSINKKSASISALIISESLHILALLKPWNSSKLQLLKLPIHF